MYGQAIPPQRVARWQCTYHVCALTTVFECIGLSHKDQKKHLVLGYNYISDRPMSTHSIAYICFYALLF